MSKHGLDERLAVERGSTAQIVHNVMREHGEALMGRGTPLRCLALIGVFEEDGMWQSMPTLACVDPQTLPTLVKVLRTMADNIEAGDRGQDRIPVKAGDA